MGTSAAAKRLVSRTALFDRLDAAVQGPVTVVAAPAGSGKSSLVRSWLAQSGRQSHSGWVAVERGARDDQRFWSHVVGALLAASSVASSVEGPAPNPDHDADVALDQLVADLTLLDEPALLVLDDVHEVADANMRRRLANFLDRLPPVLHVVLISRQDLQLGLHRRRLQGELAEIRNDDLHFTLAETRELVRSRGITLSGERLAMLHERTEGWVTGLVLATVAMATHPDPDQFVTEFSGSERTVADYLLAEVLDNQPADVRRLLLRASLLDRVNGELGDLLTEGSGAARTLRELSDGGDFVIALDPQGRWFRFHRLLADLLGASLRRSEPDHVRHLHLVSATWFAAHDLALEAITHAQAAGDHQLAAELLIRHYYTLLLDGRQSSAHSLLEAYSVDIVDNPPEITAVMAADELAYGSLDQAEAYVRLAKRGVDRVSAISRPTFEVALLLTRLTLAQRRGDFRSVEVETNSADALIEPRMSSDIGVNNDMRALLLMHLGITETWCGSTKTGADHLLEALDTARRIHRPYLEVSCLSHWAQATSWTSFTVVRKTCHDAIDLAEQHGWGADRVVAPALITLGIALIQAGRLDEGQPWIVRAEASVRVDLEPTTGYLVHMAYGAIHIARGQFTEALSSFQAAERLGLRLVSGSPLVAQQRGSALFALLRTGELDQVRNALDKMTNIQRDAGAVREITALVGLADGDAQAALDAVAPIFDGSAQSHHPVVLVRARLIQARAHEVFGNERYCEAAVESALDIAEPDTLILPFMFLASAQLLEHHPRGRTDHGAFVREILDRMSGAPLGRDAMSAAGIEPLSSAELRVLRYLSTNVSVSAIADELFVSLNTVKTHLRHVYAKFDVHTRDEAVAHARGLGLLGPESHRG